MNKSIKEIVKEVIEYTDSMRIGDRTTTNRIVHKLGYEKLDTYDLWDIENGLMEEVINSRDYVLDKSSHDNRVEGLPFNLDFVKIPKE